MDDDLNLLGKKLIVAGRKVNLRAKEENPNFDDVIDTLVKVITDLNAHQSVNHI